MKFGELDARKRIAAVAAGVVVVIGAVALAASLHNQAPTGTTITKDQLDAAVATYDQGGRVKVTARDVMASTGGVDSYKQSDDSYRLPTADSVLAYVRQRALYEDAKSQGLQASDEEVKRYLKETYATDDFGAAAKDAGVDENALRESVTEQVTIQKLQDKVVGRDSGDDTVTAPDAPEDGNGETETKGYADYIVKLAGDSWDKDANDGKGGWKDAKSSWAQALNGYEVTNDKASYNAAMVAYSVAMNESAGGSEVVSSKWSDYQDKLYSGVRITLANILQ
jgi:hypothetical protein